MTNQINRNCNPHSPPIKVQPLKKNISRVNKKRLSNLHSSLGVISSQLNILNTLISLVNPKLMFNNRAARLAAYWYTAAWWVSSNAASSAALGINLDEFSFTSPAESSAVIEASGFIGDRVKHWIIEVKDRDIILSSEHAKRITAAISFLVNLNRLIPFEGVLSDVDVLGGFKFLYDVLWVLETWVHGTTWEALWSVTA